MEQLFHARSRLPGMSTIPPILFPATYVLAVVVERLAPSRPQPKIRGWFAIGIVAFAIAGVINTLAPRLVGALHVQLVDLSPLGDIAGALCATLATAVVAYAVHRLMHVVNPLWRIHKLHHSARRVDTLGFSYANPLDLALPALLTSFVAGLLGVSPLASTIAAYVLFTSALFGHLAIATPHWLGPIIQRPEAHTLHHARDVHAYNYGLPIVDLVFGTYRNPREFADRVGFD